MYTVLTGHENCIPRLKVVEAHFIRLATVCTDIGTVIKVVEFMCHMILERFRIGEDIIADVTCVCCVRNGFIVYKS